MMRRSGSRLIVGRGGLDRQRMKHEWSPVGVLAGDCILNWLRGKAGILMEADSIQTSGNADCMTARCS